jgi:hypothetical protein
MKLSASRTQALADISRMLALAKEEELEKMREVILQTGKNLTFYN